jgi:hypothetical protein
MMFNPRGNLAFTLTKYTDKLAQAVMFLTCIQQVTGSSLGQDTGYLDTFL